MVWSFVPFAVTILAYMVIYYIRLYSIRNASNPRTAVWSHCMPPWRHEQQCTRPPILNSSKLVLTYSSQAPSAVWLAPSSVYHTHPTSWTDHIWCSDTALNADVRRYHEWSESAGFRGSVPTTLSIFVWCLRILRTSQEASASLFCTFC